MIDSAYGTCWLSVQPIGSSYLGLCTNFEDAYTLSGLIAG